MMAIISSRLSSSPMDHKEFVNSDEKLFYQEEAYHIEN
jgi:hypothetical protein